MADEPTVKLYLGDCLDILPTLPDGCVNAVVTDLPYGTTACAWDFPIPFEPMWREFNRLTGPSGIFVTTSSQPFTSSLIMSNLKQFRYCWIWHKLVGANFLNLSNRPFKTCEDIVVFAKTANFTFNPIRTWRTESSLRRDPPGSSRIIRQRGDRAEYYGNLARANELPISSDGKKHPIDLLVFSTREPQIVYDIDHPTKKPLKLLKYLICTYTNEGDTVLDFCFGSGSTGVACVNTGRNFIGIEIDPTYYAIAEKRIAEAQMQPPLPGFRLTSGRSRPLTGTQIEMDLKERGG